MESVKPLVAAQHCVLTISDSIELIGGRFYVKATATLSDGESTISVTAFAREVETKTKMDEAQITGAASSYARKYALNGLFLIDDTKDADTMDNTKQEPKVVKPVEKTKPTVQQVIDALRPCEKVEHVEAVMASTNKYTWTPEETKQITDAKNHVSDRILFAS